MRWERDVNARVMPWKREKDPYKIWLSEVMLQQTTVQQGTGYYNRFIQKYPTVQALAAAKDEDVFKLWEGLGYYSRCRNLLHTARMVADAGSFPDNYTELLKLKGVGPYTAAAIASFAYNEQKAVVDGNVYRVLARFFGLDWPTDLPGSKKDFAELADELLDKSQPALYNQAIMDFGATVCKPKNPLCGECPLAAKCVALNTNAVNALPVKSKKLIRKERWFTYVIISHQNKVLLRQREPKDVWQNLHEFWLSENDRVLSPDELQKLLGRKIKLNTAFTDHRQTLTHQHIHIRVYEAKAASEVQMEGYEWVTRERLKEIAFPKTLKFLIENL